jgi:hypothetical protein
MVVDLTYTAMKALAKDPVALAARIALVAEENKGLNPYTPKHERYYCKTCKSRGGKAHPVTSYCFICDTDNWQEIQEA